MRYLAVLAALLVGPACASDPRVIYREQVHPATASQDTIQLPCTPSKGFTHCLHVAIFIKAPTKPIFEAFFDDPRELPKFFPHLEFRVLGEEFKKGVVYEVRAKDGGDWESFEVIGFEPPTLVAGLQIRGAFEKWQYHHYLVPVTGGTVSDELVEFVHRGPDQAAQDYIKKHTPELMAAHTALRKHSEALFSAKPER